MRTRAADDEFHNLERFCQPRRRVLLLTVHRHSRRQHDRAGARAEAVSAYDRALHEHGDRVRTSELCPSRYVQQSQMHSRPRSPHIACYQKH